MPHSLHPKLLATLAILTAALFAGLSCLCGLNHDQAIFLQAGIREAFGQIPNQDYFVPQGVVSGKLLGLFIRATPTVGWGMVLASMTLNALATLLAWRIVWRSTLSSGHAFLAAFLTALWFLPIFGTFYSDHLAYFFLLAALYVYFSLPPLFREAGAAFFFALSYHTKQSVGTAGLLACLVTACVIQKKIISIKPILRFTFSLILSHIFLLWYSHAFDHRAEYWLYSVQCPLWYANYAKSPLRLLTSLIMPWNINPYVMMKELGSGRFLFYPLVISIYFAYYAFLKIRTQHRTLASILCFTLLSTLWASSLLGRSHGHLFFGAGIVLGLVSYILNIEKVPLLIVFSFMAIVSFYLGRGVFQQSTPYLNQTSLSPIRIQKEPLSEATVELTKYFLTHEGVIATLGKSTYLVGPALGKPTVNPSIYYQRDLTIPWKHPEREEWVNYFIETLERKKAKFVVIDQAWREKSNAYLPELFRYIDEKYVVSLIQAPLQVWERRS